MHTFLADCIFFCGGADCIQSRCHPPTLVTYALNSKQKVLGKRTRKKGKQLSVARIRPMSDRKNTTHYHETTENSLKISPVHIPDRNRLRATSSRQPSSTDCSLRAAGSSPFFYVYFCFLFGFICFHLFLCFGLFPFAFIYLFSYCFFWVFFIIH